MPEKTTSAPFDFTKLMMPAFSNWAFAEREDKLEEMTFSGLQHAQRTIWDQTEKAFDDQMAFVSHRLHEDLECAKALGECRMPDEAFVTLQSFYAKMADEYQNHFKKQLELFQISLNESMMSAEELSETALETAAELSKAAEESLQEATKPVPRKRTRRANGNG